MKVEDLMTGDWVKFHLEIFLTDYEGIETVHDDVLEIGKVSALNSVGNVWVTDSEGQEYQVIDEEIEPIPLTPEILEKNGFELIKGTYPTLRNHYRDIIFQIVKIEETKYNKPFYTFKGCPIYYVHELQHALKLCGIKKEIVL